MTDLPRPARSTDERLADHAAIEHLAEEVLPALVAKLGATGLGEIEVGEDAWTIRVRRSADATSGQARRAGDRPSRSQPGHAGHGHQPGGFEGHRSARESKVIGGSAGAGSTGVAGSNGSSPGATDSTGGTGRGVDPLGDAHRVVATSPAVGVFQPRPEVKPGSRVRNGDRLGAVDMLGIAQEVVAPADGILGPTLVDAGQAVEYGQELVVIELVARTTDRSEA